MLITLNARDQANNALTVDNVINSYLFEVDNTVPDPFSTIEASSYGYNAVPKFINNRTDSIGVLVPIPASSQDSTIFNNPNGGLHIELWNKYRPGGFVDILNAVHPFSDSLQRENTNWNFYRTIDEIYDNISLIQGDSIYVLAALSDIAGNKTEGDTSLTIFGFDTLSPSVVAISHGNVFFEDGIQDTLISEDNLSAGWGGSTDAIFQNIPGSGISRYDYRINTHNPAGDSIDTLIYWRSAGLVPEAHRTDLGLAHDHQYSFRIRAVDSAGNVSATVASDMIYRLGSAPIITPIDSTLAFEDSLYTETVLVTDADLETVLSDKFLFTISWENDVSPAIGGIEIVDTSGVITWTPAPRDTGEFRLQVIVDAVSYTHLTLPTKA